MADQERVKAETEDAARIEPAVTIGHMADGQFQVVAHGLDPFKVLALLEHAKLAVIQQINPNKPRQVIPVHGRVPNITNGHRGH